MRPRRRRRSSNSVRPRAGWLPPVFLGGVLSCLPAYAYRPFDGTDASVADAGDFELELGPVQRLREGSERAWIAPAAIANWGLPNDRELVLEGKVRTFQDRPAEGFRTGLVDDALSLKQVHRRGTLQDEAGVSIASECGILLPNVHAESGTGFTCAAILSHRLPAVTFHFNAALSRTREHRGDRFFSLILEGQPGGPVRPVMEVFHERENGGFEENSALAGLIWRAAQNLSFDAGVRAARAGGEDVREVRAGLTWSFSMR